MTGRSLQQFAESLTGAEELCIGSTFGAAMPFLDGWWQRRAAQFRHAPAPRP